MTLKQNTSLVRKDQSNRLDPTTAPLPEGEWVSARKTVRVQRMNEDEQVVYGVVYEPFVLDTYGEFMTDVSVRELAHRTLRLELDKLGDVNHDNEPRDTYLVESHIAEKDDPNYPEGAWVVGMKINDPEVWADIKDGKLNGFSFEAMVWRRAVIVEVEVDVDQVMVTSEADGHDHVALVHLDDFGRVTGGRTSLVLGHYHNIYHGTHTADAVNPVTGNSHSHRYQLEG